MKSKIKIFIVVLVLLLIGVAVVIPKSTYEKWFNNDKVEEKTNNDTVSELVYVKNSDGLIVGLEVAIEEKLEDEIVQKWNLLTKDASLLPAGYRTTINKDTILNSYKINGNILELYVSAEIISSDGRSTAETLAWTFSNQEIEEIKLFVDNVEVQKINDYTVSKITRNMGINLEYETSYLLESTATIVVYCKDDYLLPITYFHLEDDVCSYILDKTYSLAEDEAVWNYEYELNEDSVVINFVNDLELNEQILMSLTYSFEANFELSKLSINNKEKKLYEAVFGVIVE